MTTLNAEKTERRPRYLRTAVDALPVVGSATPAAEGDAGEDKQPADRAPQTTTAEIWYAESGDARWTYERTETPTTPWLVTYRPTGQTMLFTTLAEGRRWTARDDGRAALGFLRAEAYRVIERRGSDGRILCFNPGTPVTAREAARTAEAELAAERLGRARRAVFVLEGAVLAGEPVTQCAGVGLLGGCSGYLLEDRGYWVHADTCRECRDQSPEKRLQCRQLHRHQSCGDPDPVLCEHSHCSAPALPALDGGQCEHGRDACCGCCGCE